jgi:predicted dinucleotide-binding enzyme
MKIGFIGAGVVAQTLAKHFMAGGHEVILSNSRGGNFLEKVVSELGSKAKVATREATAEADIVILASPWHKMKESLKGIDWKNKILVDATNQFDMSTMKIADLGNKTGSEYVSELASGAIVLKAFNHVVMDWIKNPSEDQKTVLFIAGDDKKAKAKLSTLISDSKFHPCDVGSLKDGGALLQLGGSLNGLHLKVHASFTL